MKISLYWFKSKLCTTEEKNREFRNIRTETIQTKDREKNFWKNYQNISALGNHMYNNNLERRDSISF